MATYEIVGLNEGTPQLVAPTSSDDGKIINITVMQTFKVADTSDDHYYSFAVSELAADRTVTLPLLTGNDTFVFEGHTQTLTNKTLTSPSLESPNVSSGGLSVAGTERISAAGAVSGTIGAFTTRVEIEATGPFLRLIESDEPTTHQQSWWRRDGSITSFQTRNSGASVVSSDYLMTAGASGVTTHAWRITNTEKASLDSSGLSVVDNLILATAGKGVDFSANGGGVLDQYQETTFTPVLSDGTNDATSSIAVGSAVKIGEFVFAAIHIVLSSKGSISGNLRVTGLPFTTDNLTNSWNGGRAYATNLNITAGQSVGYATPPNVTYINLYLSDSTAGDTALQDTEVTDTTVIRLSFSYRAIS